MKYVSTQEISKKWNTSLRNVQRLLGENRVEGAIRQGRIWLVPENASMPSDPRKPNGNKPLHLQLPKSLYMSKKNLKPVGCEVDPIYDTLINCNIAYAKGDFVMVKKYFLKCRDNIATGFPATLIAIPSAIATEDYYFYDRINEYLDKLYALTDEKGQKLIQLVRAIRNESMAMTLDRPQWLTDCDFSDFDKDNHLLIVYAYALYLRNIKDYSALFHVSQLALSLFKEEGAFSIFEIYFLLMCALSCRAMKDIERAKFFLKKALALGIPHKIIAPYEEYLGEFGGLMEECLTAYYPKYCTKIIDGWQTFFYNWIRVHNKYSNNNITTLLTAKEYHIAMLLRNKVSYKEIGQWVHLSQGRVRNIVSDIYGKLGINKRSELNKFFF